MFLNLPFGETMAEQKASGYYNNAYKFNGKEQDAETGLYYYSARYYDPRSSVWLNVDPMSEKYANLSPYNYCANNPVLFVDPNGEDIVIHYKENSSNKVYRFTGNSKGAPDNPFVGHVISAWNYNVQNGGGDKMFEAATNPNISVHVTEGLVSQRRTIDGGLSVVFWNPLLGSLTDEDYILSPATHLEHEIAHEVNRQTNYPEYKSRKRAKNTQYENNEEMFVIQGPEAYTAYKNGEVPQGYFRKNHKGVSVITNNPKSNIVNKKASIEYYHVLDRKLPYGIDKDKYINEIKRRIK